VVEGWRTLCSKELYKLYACISDQMKEDEMSGKCRLHGRDEKYVQYFDWKT